MIQIKPISLDKLGKIFRPWHTAPKGTIVAYGGRCATGSGNNWQEHETRLVCVVALGEGNNPCLVAVQPTFAIIMRPPSEGSFRHFVSTITFDDPAVDISDAYELGVGELAPAGGAVSFDLGQVVLADDGTLLSYVGETMHERFLVLSGSSKGNLVGRPTGNFNKIGKLAVVEKK